MPISPPVMVIAASPPKLGGTRRSLLRCWLFPLQERIFPVEWHPQTFCATRRSSWRSETSSNHPEVASPISSGVLWRRGKVEATKPRFSSATSCRITAPASPHPMPTRAGMRVVSKRLRKILRFPLLAVRATKHFLSGPTHSADVSSHDPQIPEAPVTTRTPKSRGAKHHSSPCRDASQLGLQSRTLSIARRRDSRGDTRRCCP